eukprot:CAMPEP_0197696026 /NCGR_PEP_ID=MMETSP1338-20131121/116027_1 /TAXON_ID=43686 ORGANISM="Pelagodinium beii, Strain RCC1491" /NCGR_SAMPLE_ID=MMETSP1338 /ASSEMBLY_ACC=CAM_ASM_000754 /LENGTH=144 /DNA_ID=CAMNT_0043279075 /DNA_START=49 /DNA_END=480 /DNA_ORIENTATION=-
MASSNLLRLALLLVLLFAGNAFIGAVSRGGLASRSAVARRALKQMELRKLETVEEFKSSSGSSKISVAMFSSSMCGPCLLVEPKIAELSQEFGAAGIDIFKVNLVPGTPNAKALKPLFSELEVRALPTFIVYKAGEILGRVEGT